MHCQVDVVDCAPPGQCCDGVGGFVLKRQPTRLLYTAHGVSIGLAFPDRSGRLGVRGDCRDFRGKPFAELPPTRADFDNRI